MTSTAFLVLLPLLGPIDEPPHSATEPSPSFAVYSYSGGPDPVSFANRCQRAREQLHRVWLGDRSVETWAPPCEIVLHASRASYARSIGGTGIRSYGSSLIQSDQDGVTRRRIDLLVNPHGEFTALHHELCHVVLADRFAPGKPPLWANEGIATRSDSASKQALHKQDCVAALVHGTTLRMHDLLHLEAFHSPHQAPAFYGQSLSVVEFLVHRGDSTQLLSFLEAATEHGYDQALRDVYKINGVTEFEALWYSFAAGHLHPSSQWQQMNPVGSGGD